MKKFQAMKKAASAAALWDLALPEKGRDCLCGKAERYRLPTLPAFKPA